MLVNPNDPLDWLLGKLQRARAVTPELMAEFVAGACSRLPLLNRTGKTAGDIAGLVQSSAWVDAALALIQLELPGWTLRRLAYDEGEWHCALSGQPALPVELDDVADAHHEVLPLALMCAFLEVRRRAGAPRDQTVPQALQAHTHAVCCDNFA